MAPVSFEEDPDRVLVGGAVGPLVGRAVGVAVGVPGSDAGITNTVKAKSESGVRAAQELPNPPSAWPSP